MLSFGAPAVSVSPQRRADGAAAGMGGRSSAVGLRGSALRSARYVVERSIERVRAAQRRSIRTDHDGQPRVRRRIRCGRESPGHASDSALAAQYSGWPSESLRRISDAGRHGRLRMGHQPREASRAVAGRHRHADSHGQRNGELLRCLGRDALRRRGFLRRYAPRIALRRGSRPARRRHSPVGDIRAPRAAGASSRGRLADGRKRLSQLHARRGRGDARFPARAFAPFLAGRFRARARFHRALHRLCLHRPAGAVCRG